MKPALLTLRLDLPPAFAHNVVGVHGEAGSDWLKRLPDLCAEFATRWNLLLLREPVGPLSFNYVAAGTRQSDGLPVVLKLGVRCREIETEIAALQAFDGHGAVRLLESDRERGALLLERVTPGTMLTAIAADEDAATRAAVTAMLALWHPAPQSPTSPFSQIADWARGLTRHRKRFNGRTGPLPPALFVQAETLFADLLASAPEPDALLHGDLHHGNLLDAGGGRYIAIDPKGIIGDPAFEPSAFLLNPTLRSQRILARRLDIFAETTGRDRTRIRDWGIARAVLSACWTLEDNGDDWADAIAVGERLAGV